MTGLSSISAGFAILPHSRMPQRKETDLIRVPTRYFRVPQIFLAPIDVHSSIIPSDFSGGLCPLISRIDDPLPTQPQHRTGDLFSTKRLNRS